MQRRGGAETEHQRAAGEIEFILSQGRDDALQILGENRAGIFGALLTCP